MPHHILIWPSPAGNYGNQIDGVSKPASAKKRKKDGESEEEESDLIQNSSEDEEEEDGELLSVSSTPLMKPVITDRWGRTEVKGHMGVPICITIAEKKGLHIFTYISPL